MDATHEERPAGDLVAYRPCGCLGFAAVDRPTDRSYIALELARCVMAGWRPGYLTVAEVRGARWSCDECTTTDPASDEAMVVGAPPVQHEQWYSVHGSITYAVTVQVNATVAAATADAAIEAVTDQFAPVSLFDESLEAEWHDDTLIVQEAVNPAPEHTLVQPLLPFE